MNANRDKLAKVRESGLEKYYTNHLENLTVEEIAAIADILQKDFKKGAIMFNPIALQERGQL